MIRLCLLFSLLSILWQLEGAEDFAPRLDFNMPLEVSGKVVHGVGQSNFFEHASLSAALPKHLRPAFTMNYTGVDTEPEKIDRSFAHYKREFSILADGVGLQLGLSFTQDGGGKEAEYSDRIISGDCDASLIHLSKAIKDLERPVWVRIGYECNGPWNGYQPQTYKLAFQHIAKILRQHAGSQCATVWCVHPIHSLPKIMEYYPGDEFVDWWSIDLFQLQWLNRSVVRAYCQKAIEHQRPVLIGESSPAEVKGDAAEKWQTWYKPFFELIRQEPAIKGFSYINRNWNLSRWKWADCRVSHDKVLLDLYATEMTLPLYQHAYEKSRNEIIIVGAGIDDKIKEHITLNKEQSLSLDIDVPKGATLKTLNIVFRTLDQDGKPRSSGNLTIALYDGKGNALDVQRTCKPYPYDCSMGIDLNENVPEGVSQVVIKLETDDGSAVSIHGPAHPYGSGPTFLFGIPSK